MAWISNSALLLTAALFACQRAVAPTASPFAPHNLATMDPGGQGRVDLLIRDRETAVAKLPKVDAWVVLGQAWVRKARETADPVYYLNADACATEALKLDPDSEQAQELRVLLQLSNHQFALARETAEKALSKRPDSPLMLGLLSDAQLDQGDYDGAHRSLQSMLDLKPNLPSYSRAAYLQWLKGDRDEALKSVRLAFDSGDPKEPEASAWVLVQAAMIFWQGGDYQGAEAGFDKALQTFPDFPPALVGKGRVAMAQADPKQAAALLDQAFRQSPLMSTAWLLDDARVAAGDSVGARRG
jgi:tetratricopeptide (TPR) repeat protein